MFRHAVVLTILRAVHPLPGASSSLSPELDLCCCTPASHAEDARLAVGVKHAGKDRSRDEAEDSHYDQQTAHCDPS